MSAEVIVTGPRGATAAGPHRPRSKQSRWLRAPRLLAGSQAPALSTIDVEDYYQVAAFRRVVRREDWDWYPSRVERNVERLLDLLDEQGGVKATWFVLGWEAERRPAMIRAIAERGHEIACHSHWHREVFSLTPEQFREDTLVAKRAIERACGQSIVGYRAPSFSLTRDSLWALEILAELGFRYDSSIFPVLHPRYGIPGAAAWPHQLRAGKDLIWELPPATAPMFGRRWAVAGGGYLRHLPFAAIHAGLKILTRREKLPGVLYVHPWEIDPRQPRLAGGAITRRRHYHNLSRTESRLSRLLKEFPFWTCSRLVEALESEPEAATERVAARPAPTRAGAAPVIPRTLAPQRE